MEVPGRTIIVGNGFTKQRIRFITDTHHGADSFRDDLFDSFKRAQEQDPNSVWIHGGDVGNPDRNSRRELDNISNANRQDEIYTQSEKNKLWVEKHIIPKYKSISKSCLGFLAGDHYMIIDGKPCTEYICARLNVPYLGERNEYVNITFRCKNSHSAFQYVIHARHGKCGGGTMGGDVNNMVKMDTNYLADLHLGGHTHKENCHPSRMEYITHKGTRKYKIIWHVRGGSFLDGFPYTNTKTYAYKKEYSPLPCGWAEIELDIARRGSSKDTQDTQLGVKSSRATIIAA